jgi:biotin synthase
VGLLGGVTACIGGNSLTTRGRDPAQDLALLSDLRMPIKELAKTL